MIDKAISGVVGGIAGSAFDFLDDIITSDEEREQMKLKLMTEEGRQALKKLEVGVSVILAEASSADPWTSRARPSFFYVMYIFILMAIPMGIISAYDPDIARRISEGMTAYLSSLPDSLYALFGTGFLGYGAYRSYEKAKGVAK